MLCEFPNGRMQRRDGSTYPIACDNDATREIGGWLFCKVHAGMVERGCLAHHYTNGKTLQQAMEEAALHRIIEKYNGRVWQGFPCGRG